MFSRIESSANMPSFFLSSEQKPMPAIIALAGSLMLAFFPLTWISPWFGAVDPEDEPRHLGPARTQEAGQTEHLAFVQVEIEGRDGALQPEILDVEDRSSLPCGLRGAFASFSRLSGRHS